MHFTYIILCDDSSLYTGITDNVDRRFSEHKSGKGGHHTKSQKGKSLLYFEKHATKQEAAKRERQIKGWRREKKLNLIKFGRPIV